MKEWNLCR